MPMTLISRQTLTGSAASVTFNNIPQTFQTLKLVISARNDGASATGSATITFNTSTTGYSSRLLYGTGSATGSASNSGSNIIWPYVPGNTATSSTFGNLEYVIPNYSGSANKAVSVDGVNENNATGSDMGINAGLWSNTSAITSLVFSVSGANLMSGSTFSLYGIA